MKARPTIMEIPPATADIAMIWGHLVSTPTLTPEAFPTPVQWNHLRATGMVCTTWRGMCGSGVGIGMARRTRAAAILTGQLLAPSGCIGAAVGATSRFSAARRTATTNPRTSLTTARGSVPPSPQVNEQSRSALIRESRRTDQRIKAQVRSECWKCYGLCRHM